ncbi:hypothetical protein LSUE1_G004570, partial [Lachnellula suecica]
LAARLSLSTQKHVLAQETMASLLLTACLALSAAALIEGLDEVTWGAVVFTYHGEKIPVLHDGPYNLTPLGANQLLLAGQTLRDRYLSASPNNTEITLSFPINGLSVNAIDNSQMDVSGMTDEYVTASALAFMQGLYPPRDAVIVDGESIMGNGSLEQFPLDGYQYPNIASMSALDYNYIWLAGDIGCPNYMNSAIETVSTSDFVNQATASQSFYDALASTVFAGIDPDTVNYDNALNLYEFALYQYNHNQTVYNSLDPSDLDALFVLASEQQWAYNTPSGGNSINSIAGQTFASKVVQQLGHNIESQGMSDKLTLMFGSHQPFTSFFALSNLSTGPAAKAFNSMPQHGSFMAFELFSNPTSFPNNSIPFPTNEDGLYVRFLFRNGTDDRAPIIQYPLFGRGNSEVDMPWNDFVNAMYDISINYPADWCTTCGAANLFCQGIEVNVLNSTGQISNPSSSPSHSSLSPAIAGVIGATVTLAVGILVGVIACLFGFRVNYQSRASQGNAGDLGVLRSGGFKGAEKLASDTDLRLKGGAGATVVRHERVG